MNATLLHFAPTTIARRTTGQTAKRYEATCVIDCAISDGGDAGDVPERGPCASQRVSRSFSTLLTIRDFGIEPPAA